MMSHELTIPQQSDFLIYQNDNGQIKIEVCIHNETIWLTQKKKAELFDCTSDNIGLHLKNIYQTNELNENSTTKKFSVVQQEGNRKVNRDVKL